MVSKTKIAAILNKFHLPNWLLILLALVIILRIPSFFEPYSYGDEMIYLTLGEGIRQGVPLYKNLHDNKPPLLYVMAAASGSLFWFKVILAGWCLGTILIFWKLVEKLFPGKSKLQKTAVWVFALLTTLPLFEGNVVNAELFMIGPTILAFYLLLFSKKDTVHLLSAGICFSVATLFKVPAAFDALAIVSFWLIYSRWQKKELFILAKNLILIFIGFAAPILLSILWYFFRGALPEYLVAAFLQNLGYLSSWSGKAKNSSLLIKFAFVILGEIILFIKRKSLSKEFVFLTLWTLFSSFAVALSERPYPHYFVQALAPVSILLGLFFTDKTVTQSLSLIPLGIAFFVPFYYKFWYYPTSSYYGRFLKLVTGQVSREGYLNSFNDKLARNYQVADLVDKVTKREDRIFVWGDSSSSLYALTRRLPAIKYAADYHIKDFSSVKEVADNLAKTPPTVIVVMPEASPFPELKLFLEKSYLLLAQIEQVQIWKKLKPEVQSIINTDFF